MLTEKQGRFLLRKTRDIIETFVKSGEVKKLENNPLLDWKCGVFCTLEKNGKLRGCIGIPYPTLRLKDALVEAATSVCHDPRFPPLAPEELDNIEIEISLLSEPKETTKEEIKQGDGVIIKRGSFSALFLPQVWKHFSTKEEFMANLCLKAGLPPDAWKDENTKIFKFGAQVFKEQKG
jgi:hypothetical protein